MEFAFISESDLRTTRLAAQCFFADKNYGRRDSLFRQWREVVATTSGETEQEVLSAVFHEEFRALAAQN